MFYRQSFYFFDRFSSFLQYTYIDEPFIFKTTQSPPVQLCISSNFVLSPEEMLTIRSFHKQFVRLQVLWLEIQKENKLIKLIRLAIGRISVRIIAYYGLLWKNVKKYTSISNLLCSRIIRYLVRKKNTYPAKS